MNLEPCWDAHSPLLLDGILGILPGPKTAFKHQWTLHPSVLEHPSNPCSPHTEPRLVYDGSFVASEAEPSKFGFEVSVKCIQILVVGSWVVLVAEVSISLAVNMATRVGCSGVSLGI